MDERVRGIIARALDGEQPSIDEAVYLLNLDPAGSDAAWVRAAANNITRARCDNAGAIFGQIGIDVYPCEADCQFCSFGRTHTGFKGHSTLDLDTIERKAREFADGGDLCGMWLMTMASFDREYYLEAVRRVRSAIPASTRIYTNIGDVDQDYLQKLKDAGIYGCYHVIRLGEGEVTKIDPSVRQRTIDAIREVGLHLQDCCEPIGPEHTAEDIAAHLYKTVEKGCIESGVMSRTPVPGTIFEGPGIPLMKLLLVLAVNAFVMLGVEGVPFMSFNPVTPLGLISGGNRVCAETGANPRDVVADTSSSCGIGLDMNACRKMLFDAGFSKIMRGDGTTIDLTYEYLRSFD